MSSVQTTDVRSLDRIECGLIASAAFQASLAEIPSLRKVPDPSGRSSVAGSLLRQADEQTVVGLAAVFAAIRGSGLEPTRFGDWSVLAAPRYLGRSAFEHAFPVFRQEGAWGVSPHLIPAHSLHSPSGTISQALRAQGPNLGVGGTPGSEREALVLAASLLHSGAVPGIWVVLSERIDEGEGRFEALAMALIRPEPGQSGQRLRISPGRIDVGNDAASPSRALDRWLAPGSLRADQSHARAAVPTPLGHRMRRRGEKLDD